MLSPQLTELLTAYVDGEATPRQRKAVTRLLRKSAEARRFLEHLETDSSELRRLPRAHPTRDFSGSVLAAISRPEYANAIRKPGAAVAAAPLPVGVPIIRGVPTRQPVRGGFFRILKLTVAAAVLICAGLGSYVAFTNLDNFHLGFFAQQPTRPIDNAPPVPQPTGPEEKMYQDQPRVGDSTTLGSLVHESVAMQPYGPLLPEMRTQSDLDHFLTILRPKPQPFVNARPRLMPIVPVRDVDQTAPGQELLKEVQLGVSTRFDLFCADPNRAFDRLQSVLAANGVTLQVSADVKNRLARHQRSTLTLYSEDLTPADLDRIFRQLAVEERKPSAGVFDKLTLNPSSPGELARLLGGDPSHYQPTIRGPLGVDVSRPLADQTAQQLGAKLDGERTENHAVERRALVILHNPLQPAVPREVKQLLDNRKEWHVGNVQLVLVLWPN